MLLYNVSIHDFGSFEGWNFRREGSPQLRFGLVFDLGYLMFYCYSVPCQIYFGARLMKNKAISTGVTLEMVLDDSIGRALFRQHLIHEFSVENLNFIEAVESFNDLLEKKASRAQIVTTATSIYRIYLAPDAINGLNIAFPTMLVARERFTSGNLDESLFKQAHEEVLSLVNSDSFFRFTLTKEFKDYIGSTELENAI